MPQEIRAINREVDNELKEIYISANINDGTTLSELMGVFTKDDCYSENFPVTSKMKHDFKYVKEGNKMTCNEGIIRHI